jgi:hypothetical protein
MLATGYGQPYRHPTQRCKNCDAPIWGRAAWTNKIDGLDRPLPDEKWCEAGCTAAESGAYQAA